MRCKACDHEISVRWVRPEGSKEVMLEELCYQCLKWVEVAKSPTPLQPPSARRHPFILPLPIEVESEKDV